MAGSLNQCLIQKAIERILDGGYIVTHFPGQQSFVDKKVNFGFVELKRKAAKFIAASSTVSPHARGGRRQSFNLCFNPIRHGRFACAEPTCHPHSHKRQLAALPFAGQPSCSWRGLFRTGMTVASKWIGERTNFATTNK